MKIFGKEPNVCRTLNDNSGTMFKAFKTIFPLAFLMNSFAHVIARNLVKRARKLNDEGNYMRAKHDLIKICDLAFEEDCLRALDLFRTECVDEFFLHAFER